MLIKSSSYAHDLCFVWRIFCQQLQDCGYPAANYTYKNGLVIINNITLVVAFKINDELRDQEDVMLTQRREWKRITRCLVERLVKLNERYQNNITSANFYEILGHVAEKSLLQLQE